MEKQLLRLDYTWVACVAVGSHLVQVERFEMGQLRAPELDETVLSGSDQSPRAVVQGVDAPLMRTKSLFQPPNRHDSKWRRVRQVIPR